MVTEAAKQSLEVGLQLLSGLLLLLPEVVGIVRLLVVAAKPPGVIAALLAVDGFWSFAVELQCPVEFGRPVDGTELQCPVEIEGPLGGTDLQLPSDLLVIWSRNCPGVCKVARSLV